jgi:signal transduction histidine kinase
MNVALLKSIIDNRFIVDERDKVTQLTPTLLKNLGAVEWELRDYSYMILSSWIWGWHDRTYYNNEELLQLADCAKRNIKIGLGEGESDGVFLRTYSILLLNDLTDYDRSHPYLEEKEIRDRLELYLTYLEKEQDLRGYVSSEKGWAHGIAHVADSIDILSRNSYLNRSDLIRLLSAISSKLRHPISSVYLHSEEERLARSAVSICQRDILTIEQISAWLQTLIEPDRRRPSGHFVWDDFEKYPWRKILTDPIEKLCAYRNIQNFLRAFYFQWKHQENRLSIKDLVLEEIDRALQFIDTGFYQTEQGFFLNP